MSHASFSNLNGQRWQDDKWQIKTLMTWIFKNEQKEIKNFPPQCFFSAPLKLCFTLAFLFIFLHKVEHFFIGINFTEASKFRIYKSSLVVKCPSIVGANSSVAWINTIMTIPTSLTITMYIITKENVIIARILLDYLFSVAVPGSRRSHVLLK